MKTQTTQLLRSNFTRLSAAVAIALLAVFSTVSVASAHDELIKSDPAAGSTLTASPKELTLEFSGELQSLAGTETSVVAITAEDGTKVQSTLSTKGTKVVVLPQAPLTNGEYKLAYRVVSSDGHPIDNSYEFTVADPAAATAAPSTPAMTAPDASQSAPATQAPGSDEPIQQLGSQLSPVVWIVVGIAVLGAALAVLIKFVRQNK